MLASRQPIWIGWGPELTYLYNDPYKTIIGGKHPGALGCPTHVVWGEIWNDIGPLLAKALEGGEGTYSEEQLLIMERHGYQEETYYTFSYTSIPDDNGSVGGIICANTDDTQRVLAERQLALLKELAGCALQSANAFDACIQSAAALETNSRDLPFALLYVIDGDAVTARLAGTSGIDFGHPSVWPQIELSDDGHWPIGQVLRTGEQCVVQLCSPQSAAWPSGPWRVPPTQAVVLPILPSGKKGCAGVLIAGLNPLRKLDAGYQNFLGLVTAQIASNLARADAFEEEKKRAAALAEIDRAKTVFFSNASHEFRTPLSLMLGPLDDMLVRAPSEPAVKVERHELELMQRNGQRLLKLVNTLLDFSRFEAGRMQGTFEPVDLSAYTAELTGVFRSAMARAGLQFRVDCPPLLEPVYVDRDMWEKIVLNLLSNAFKYTLEGEVAVSLRAANAGHSVELCVRDTGVGIPTDQLPHLFERFHRIEGQAGRTREGTGIGLALVQELVRFHGGTISVQSNVGSGTRFVVSIPKGPTHLPAERIRNAQGQLSAGAGAAAFAAEALRWLPSGDAVAELDAGGLASSPERATAAGDRPYVLLADDNTDMRGYVRRLLSDRYEVHAVSDGKAALEAARTRRPDLVLSDVMMPQLDGIGLLRALREDNTLRDIPVILLSARAGDEASVDGLEAGADDYLVKPFSARELLARVRANIDLSVLRRETARVENELRVQAEIAKERTETILSSISDGFMALDCDWRFTYLNPAAERLLGRSSHELIGKSHWDEYPAIAGSSLEANYRSVMDERVSFVFENYYSPWHKWFEIRAFPARDGGLSIYFHDITERKTAEYELRNKNAELEAVLEAVPAAVWIARDPACHVIVGNRAGVELLRLTTNANASKSAPAEEAPQNFKILSNGVELHADELPIQRAAATGQEVRGVQESIVFEDGQTRTIYGNAAPLRDAEGEVRGAIGAFIDISELAQAREFLASSHDRLERLVEERTAELRAKEAQVRTIFETSFAYQGLMTIDGTLIDANATSLEGIGAGLESVLGKPFWETAWFSRTPGMPEMVRTSIPLVAKGGTVRQEIRVNLPVGGWRWFDFQIRPVRDDKGSVVAIVPEAVDVTVRREAEEALRHAQKMDAIGQLTGSVAHDFNNFLTIIRSASDLLRKPNLPEERRWRYMNAITDTADRAAKLTNQLLAFARRQALSAHVFDVSERIGSVAEMLRTVLGPHIKLELEFHEIPLAVEVDSNQFETALVNLAANARDAIDGIGSLKVKVTLVQHTPADVCASGTNGFVSITVADDGCGMPPELINKVFEPFFTTKDVGHGTGLGLSQVYGFTKQSGGAVVAESEVGRGTTFTLYLPRSPKAIQQNHAQSLPVEAQSTERGHVLIIEDNAEVGSFTCQLFDELGYDTDLASNGEQGLALLRENARCYDLVFSDVMMPGIDGVSLAREIRKRLPQLPVLLTSGYSQVLAKEGQYGFELIHKPYTLEGLAKAIQRTLSERGAT